MSKHSGNTLSATAPPSATKTRIFELDLLRGLAVILMSTYHFLFDLAVYYGKPISVFSGGVMGIGRSSAILFMIVSGISATFSKKSIKRGFIVLACGMLVTAGSLFTMGNEYIRFGILHFFGTVMILKGLIEKIIKNRTSQLITACFFIPFCFLLAPVVRSTTVNSFWLLPLGIVYPGFASLDFYPLFPWAGFFCIGIVVGMLVYKSKQSLFAWSVYLPQTNKNGRFFSTLLRPFCFIGRHSLVAYIVHQPIFLALLWVLHTIGLL